ncbi:hypothetical protein RHMOL_Rhmol06G0237600 [Rhododendron molle]|uniref:Uncharacterized protein n=1 Tax=Rhododendron molle TaxID=49168 RepID=A0ACC0NHM5_RHOML|nr:hypothetical protein RHMOL_Rhmol06G0237600 [Rhododendron molle]
MAQKREKEETELKVRPSPPLRSSIQPPPRLDRSSRIKRFDRRLDRTNRVRTRKSLLLLLLPRGDGSRRRRRRGGRSSGVELYGHGHGGQNVGGFKRCLVVVEGVGDDGGVDAGVKEGEALLEEGLDDDEVGGGVAASDNVLGIGDLDTSKLRIELLIRKAIPWNRQR